jgi:hypothetical protein
MLRQVPTPQAPALDVPIEVPLTPRQCFALLAYFDDDALVAGLRDALAAQGVAAPVSSSDEVLRVLYAAPQAALGRPPAPETFIVEVVDDTVTVDGEMYSHADLAEHDQRLVRIVRETVPMTAVVVTTLTRREICRVQVVPGALAA